MEVMEKASPLFSKQIEKLDSAFKADNICKDFVLTAKYEPTSLNVNFSSENSCDNYECSSGPGKTVRTATATIKAKAKPQKLIIWTNQEAKSKSSSTLENDRFDDASASSDTSLLSVKNNSNVRKKQSPKIEVCQKDFKTVVKIVVKETPVLEEEKSLDNNLSIIENNHVYENGCVQNGKFKNANSKCKNDDQVIYENVFVSKEKQSDCCETSASNCRKVFLHNNLYINVNEINTEPEDLIKLSDTKAVSDENGSQKLTKVSGNVENWANNNSADDCTYENVKNSCLACTNVKFSSNQEKNLKCQQSHLNCENNEASEPPDVSMTMEHSPTHKFFENGNAAKDPFDSGTSSDVDSLPTGAFVQSLKRNVPAAAVRSVQNEEAEHRRAESLTSSGLGVDSEESDGESISCDSLNGSESYFHCQPDGSHSQLTSADFGEKIGTSKKVAVQQNSTPEDGRLLECTGKPRSATNENRGEKASSLKGKTDFQKLKTVETFEKNLIRSFSSTNENENDLDKDYDDNDNDGLISRENPKEENEKNLKTSTSKVIQFLELKSSKNDSETETQNASSVTENKKPNSVVRLDDKESVTATQICGFEVDTDQFYRFHISENFRENNSEEDETFAGVKDYFSREKSSNITSAKGTIRGVRNRVKAGIATFLQIHENKCYKDRDAGKVVVYTTTMGIVRETYQKCLKVKQILRTLMVKFEERDVFMSAEAQEEIRTRMKCKVILVPQIFVEGQHIGDAESLERLNETGELRMILKPYKSPDACITCKVCGGYRLLPCNICKGSKKSIHRNNFTSEFVSLKCMNCDQVGLTKCYAC